MKAEPTYEVRLIFPDGSPVDPETFRFQPSEEMVACMARAALASQGKDQSGLSEVAG